MDTSIYNRPDKELLEWELSLNSSDLRAHAWYHGNIPRIQSELLLLQDGEFLVRDSSTFARSGDYVLSCKWKGTILHFLIHKEVMQPDTIYEQLGYRFENESFTTVQDLITFHVGNKEPISAKSGAIISFPRTRVVPLSRKNRILPLGDLTDNEYVSISQEAILPVDAVLIERSFTAESLYQVALNLKPPPGILEALHEIPDRILNSNAYKSIVESKSERDATTVYHDLSTFSSILLPTKLDDVIMSPSILQLINSRILEASDRAIAYHITKVDWEALQRTPGESTDEEPVNNEEKRDRRIYEKLLHDPRFRWDMIIERSLTFSHFVTISILQAESKESMFSKWIGIANELKISMGNFLSFCNIMRGLICPKFNTVDNAIDWMKLRREFTNSTFQFETVLRNSYNQLQQGTEAYPPNTTIPNFLPGVLILEEQSKLLPFFRNVSEEDKLRLTVAHMRQFYHFCDNEAVHTRNIQRIFEETNVVADIILSDMFLTEVHLIILWGPEYAKASIGERCKDYE